MGYGLVLSKDSECKGYPGSVRGWQGRVRCSRRRVLRNNMAFLAPDYPTHGAFLRTPNPTFASVMKVYSVFCIFRIFIGAHDYRGYALQITNSTFRQLPHISPKAQRSWRQSRSPCLRPAPPCPPQLVPSFPLSSRPPAIPLTLGGCYKLPSK